MITRATPPPEPNQPTPVLQSFLRFRTSHVLAHIMRDFMAVLICVGLPAICGLASPPDNDNFADRRVLVGGAVQDVVGIAGATVEPGEPMRTNCFSRTESVWWTWTAPASGTVNIRASAYCSVWSGDSLTNLLFLGDHSDPFVFCFPGVNAGGPPPVRLDVSQGQALQISAAGGSGDTRLVQLNLDLSTVQIL